MKALAALIFGTISFALSIPLVFANGGNSTGVYACGQLGTILDTIRTLESGGNYQIEAAGSSASARRSPSSCETPRSSGTCRGGGGCRQPRAIPWLSARDEGEGVALARKAL